MTGSEHQPTPSDPDDDRTHQVAHMITEEFLDAHPGHYFRTRAIHWAETADRPAEGGTAAWPATPAGAEVLARLGEDYVPLATAAPTVASTLDAFMLARHAAECLMRHLFALLDAKSHSTVPWVAMVALQEGRDFRNRLTAVTRAGDDALDELITALFIPPELAALMQADTASVADEAEDRAADARRFCRAWIRHFARFCLESGNGYNAAKHGLSTVAGHSQLSFHPDPDTWSGPGPVPESMLMLEGPEIRTIEHEKVEGQRRWLKVTRHVDPPGLIATTLIAADLLDWLWEIERARARATPAEVPVRTDPMPRDVIAGHEKSWGRLRLPLQALPLGGAVKEATLRRLGLLTESGESAEATPPGDNDDQQTGQSG